MPLSNLPQIARNYWRLILPRRKSSIIYFLFLCAASGALESISIGALYPFIESFSTSKQTATFSILQEVLPSTWSSSLITIILGSLLIALNIINTISRCVVIKFQNMLTANIGADIACSLFTAIQKSPYKWHLANGTNKVMHIITQDVEIMTVGLNSCLTFASNAIISLILASALLIIEPTYTLSVMLILSIYYILIFYGTRARIKDYAQLSRHHYAQSYQVVLESSEGIKDVIINDLSKYNSDRFKVNFLNGRIASAQIDINAQMPRYLLEGFIVVLIVSALLYLIIGGFNVAKIAAVLTTVLLGFYKLLQPVQNCFSSISKIQVAQQALNESAKILDSSTLSITENRATFQSVKPTNHLILRDKTIPRPLIEFVNVKHIYSDSHRIALDDLSFSINKGDMILIMGPSGSGKSTLINTILGLLEPTSGQVIVDNSNLYHSRDKLREWQHKLSHVPQDVTLYSDTFSANIALGIDPDKIDLHMVKNAARCSAIDEYIVQLKDGYHSSVGHRGNQLSGGQRQRIALARAFYKQSQIIVLDEPTSALDLKTATQVIASISKLHESGATIIINSHQFTVLSPDMKTMIMKQGKIVYYGHYSGCKYDNQIGSSSQHS